MINYIHLATLLGASASCVGDPSNYENVTWHGTPETKEALNARYLGLIRDAKIIAIDARTEALIAAGFTYAGKQFSLSLPSQSKMIGTYQVKDLPQLAYPINWNTLDDADIYEIASAADLTGFYLTAFGTIRARLDSGTAIKSAVRAATTVAQIDAIVDPR